MSLFSHLCIRLYLDLKTASSISTSTVHSKLDYCNSLYCNLPNSEILAFSIKHDEKMVLGCPISWRLCMQNYFGPFILVNKNHIIRNTVLLHDTLELTDKCSKFKHNSLKVINNISKTKFYNFIHLLYNSKLRFEPNQKYETKLSSFKIIIIGVLKI